MDALFELPDWATCVLCSDWLKCPVTVGCEHAFCAGCLEPFLGVASARNLKRQCPVCRQDAPDVLRSHSTMAAKILKYKTACMANHLKERFYVDWDRFADEMDEVVARAADMESEMDKLREQIQQQHAGLKSAMDARVEALLSEDIDGHLEEEVKAFRTALEAPLDALFDVATSKHSALVEFRTALEANTAQVNLVFNQFTTTAIAVDAPSQEENGESADEANSHFTSAAGFIALVKARVGESVHTSFVQVLFSYGRGEIATIADALAACSLVLADYPDLLLQVGRFMKSAAPPAPVAAPSPPPAKLDRSVSVTPSPVRFKRPGGDDSGRASPKRVHMVDNDALQSRVTRSQSSVELPLRTRRPTHSSICKHASSLDLEHASHDLFPSAQAHMDNMMETVFSDDFVLSLPIDLVTPDMPTSTSQDTTYNLH
eukprot:TRINITY_DN7195_c0_g1_i1.p1 TRINITY_DN7195_c0_g1~~TRINITY_DN7195_c0_g1_i1.p1  ORF type:complete len:431 (+),score=58.22 TRINITY_DN7195_c0_g1_i1:31-1323(+)